MENSSSPFLSLLAKSNQMFGITGGCNNQSVSVFVRKLWISTEVHEKQNDTTVNVSETFEKIDNNYWNQNCKRTIAYSFNFFDGWSLGDAQYENVFATFFFGNEYGYEKILFGIS